MNNASMKNFESIYLERSSVGVVESSWGSAEGGLERANIVQLFDTLKNSNQLLMRWSY
jgi:hypothetical protein